MNTAVNPQGKGNILIVDDTPANLRLLTGMLKDQGYKVRPVPNGQLALNAVKAASPELILLDITMPGMDGYEVAHHLKADEATREIPIIFISALDETEDKVKAFQSGGVDYITKPFQFEEVLARVETHLSLWRLQQQLEQRVRERTCELEQLNQSLARFVPAQMLDYLGKKSITDVQLGDQVQGDMAVLFTDMRGFTARAEQMPPQENFKFLNSYLGQVSPVIRANYGFIDKYLGDGLMAVFPRSPEDAIKAAIAMREELTFFNQHQKAQNLEPVRIGTGINIGKVTLGVIGEEQRVQGTVISDAVNVASRLEGITKIYDITIAACQGTVMSLPHPDDYHYRFIDQVQAQGRQQVMNVLEIFDGDPPDILELKEQTKPDFEHGLNFYFDRRFDQAVKAFKRVLAVHDGDKVTQIHLQRAERYAVEGVPDDWGGVEALQTK